MAFNLRTENKDASSQVIQNCWRWTRRSFSHNNQNYKIWNSLNGFNKRLHCILLVELFDVLSVDTRCWSHIYLLAGQTIVWSSTLRFISINCNQIKIPYIENFISFFHFRSTKIIFWNSLLCHLFYYHYYLVFIEIRFLYLILFLV